jgi:hypothetical protein
MLKKFANIFLTFFSLFVLELISQVIILKFENKFSIIFKPLANNIFRLKSINEQLVNYQISWDFKNNKMKPGVYMHKDIKYNINSKGFRGKEFEIEKKKIRIAVFGGSTTIGLESPEDKTYPYQLEQFLNKSSDSYEVINMGFGSKSLRFIKSLFFNEVYIYKPDFIIIYNNRNSIMYDGSSVEHSFENAKILRIHYSLLDNIMTYRLIKKIYNKIYNYNINTKYLKSPFHNKGISKEYLLNGYKNSLIEIIKFANEKKIKVVLVKEAYNFNSNIIEEVNIFSIDDLIEKYEKNFFIQKYNLDETSNFWIVLGAILNKKLDELTNFDNVIVVDPIKKLLKSKDNFTDYIHLTPRGNEILAKEIYNSIIN